MQPDAKFDRVIRNGYRAIYAGTAHAPILAYPGAIQDDRPSVE